MGIFNVTTDMNNDSTLVDIESLSESVLLELYFGDGVVSKLQSQFSKFRSKYSGNKAPWSPKINYDADLIKFNRMCEEQFGYSRFCLSVSPTYDYNAYMINIGWLSDDNVSDEFFNNLKIYKDSRGFRYDKDAKVSALSNIFFGLIVDETFTDREVFAIMLHEIGHSFTYAVLNRDGVIGRGSCLVNMIRKINGAIQSNLQNDRDFTEERAERDIQSPGIVQKIKNFISSKSLVKSAIHSVSQTVKGMRKNVKYYDYTNEKFADTFASMYGYADDLQQALMKFQDTYMDFYKKDNAKIPGNISTAIKVGLLTTANMLVFLMDIKDEHPDGVTRIKVQIEYLERELRNTSLDPKMKMDLQRHLDSQKQLLEDFLSSANDPDVYRVYKMYYKKLYEKYGGDIREKYTDNEALFKTIDQRYTDLTKTESAVEDDFFGSPLNELFGFGKKKEKPKYYFPRDKYEEILKKYKDKKSLPNTSEDGLEIAAYVFCDYTTSDLDKFCNTKDTTDLIKTCTSLYETEKKSMDHDDEDYLEELEKMKQEISKIKPVSICKVIDSSSHSDVWYCKTNNKFYEDNPDTGTFLLNPIGISQFFKIIDITIQAKHKYRIYDIENLNENYQDDFFGSPLNELFGFGKANPDKEDLSKVLNMIDNHSSTIGLRKVMNVDLYPIDKIAKQSVEKDKMYTIGTITNKDDSKITESFHDYAAGLNVGLKDDKWKISIKKLPAMYAGKMMMIVLIPK